MSLQGHGNCPKCEKPVTHCTLNEVGVSDAPIGASFHGVAMCCPNCRTVLGVTADPEILINDIAYRLLHKLSSVNGGMGLALAKPYRSQR
jgi:hypothetical protein